MWDSRDLVRGRITLYEATKVKFKKKKDWLINETTALSYTVHNDKAKNSRYRGDYVDLLGDQEGSFSCNKVENITLLLVSV